MSSDKLNYIKDTFKIKQARQIALNRNKATHWKRKNCVSEAKTQTEVRLAEKSATTKGLRSEQDQEQRKCGRISVSQTERSSSENNFLYDNGYAALNSLLLRNPSRNIFK